MMLSAALLLSSVICLNPSWKQVDSRQFVNIQTDPDYQYVCAIDINKKASCARATTMNWYPVGGPFDHIVVNTGRLHAVSPTLQVQFSLSAENGQINWNTANFPGGQISADKNAICDSRGYGIVCTKQPTSNLPVKIRIRTMKRVKQVEVKDDKLFVVQEDNTLAFAHLAAPFDLNTNWTTIPGSFNQIAYDGQVLVGVTPDGNVFAASSNLETNPDWQKVDGKMRVVAVGGGGKLVGIDNNNHVFTGAITLQHTTSN